MKKCGPSESMLIWTIDLTKTGMDGNQFLEKIKINMN